MTDQVFITAMARSLYWGYMKDTTGTPGKWSELAKEGREIWLKTARRAVRKMEELAAAEQSEMPG